MIRRALALVAILLTLAPAAASALTVNEVAREVRCPTCGTPLDVSNAPVAQDMKQFIAQRIRQGWSKERIIDALVAEFGDEVRATPAKSGFDLVAWLVPAFAVLLGLAAIPVIVRLWGRRGRQRDAEPPPPSAEEAARLDDELRRMGP